jgi:hypothetical protein
MTITAMHTAADGYGPPPRDLGHFWVMSIAVHMDADGVVPLPGQQYQLPAGETFRVMDLWCPQCRCSYAEARFVQCSAFTRPQRAQPRTRQSGGGIASLSWRLRHR